MGVLVVWIWLFYLSKSRSFQFFGGLINNIQTDKPLIALTFDDGPTPDNTQKVLDILKAHNIKASFFLIGQDMEKYPEWAELINKYWHYIWNHSYSHTRMIFKSPWFVREEIEKTDELIRKAGYTWDISFRTPYGKRLLITPYYLRKFNKPNIFFDVEAESYVTSSEDILSYSLEHTHSGAIILLHPMYGGDDNRALRILDQLIIWLKEKGFQFVTVDELLKQTDTRVKFW